MEKYKNTYWADFLAQYKEEKPIFDLIRKGCSARKLKEYLMENYLPMDERYWFYLFPSDKDIYEGSLFPNILEDLAMWKQHVSAEAEKKVKINNEIDELIEYIDNWIRSESKKAGSFAIPEQYQTGKGHVDLDFFKNDCEFDYESQMYFNNRHGHIGCLRDVFDITFDNIVYTMRSNGMPGFCQFTGEEGIGGVIEKIFISRGYDFIDRTKEAKEQAGQASAEQQFKEELYSQGSYQHDFGDSSYCQVCSNSPCICSDRENTSSNHDF